MTEIQLYSGTCLLTQVCYLQLKLKGNGMGLESIRMTVSLDQPFPFVIRFTGGKELRRQCRTHLPPDGARYWNTHS